MTALDGAAVIDTAELAGRNQPKAATPEVCSAAIAVGRNGSLYAK